MNEADIVDGVFTDGSKAGYRFNQASFSHMKRIALAMLDESSGNRGIYAGVMVDRFMAGQFPEAPIPPSIGVMRRVGIQAVPVEKFEEFLRQVEDPERNLEEEEIMAIARVVALTLDKLARPDIWK